MRTTELIAGRLSYTDPIQLDAIIRIRETVRKPSPKGSTANVNLNLSVTLRAIVERVPAAQGLEYEEVLAEAESIIETGGA